MFERMSVADFKQQFPEGLPAKARTKRKKGARVASVDSLVGGTSEVEKKRPKYGNKKTEIGDLKFDSQSESDRYFELCVLLRLGDIKNLELQPKYILAEGVYLEGENKKKDPLMYIADFTYYCLKRNKQIIEDVKSPSTAKCKAYRIKKHLMKAYLGLDITEVIKP